ncbi:RtcB family protein [Pararhizobium polonicum]|uniref:RtcB family protein n=1 Tax=Pararhizobium polonicum TaxID=1612624 RepID=UPI00083A331C|nr:RtcB family protein [Pararhizobium polonicum]
MSHPSTSKFAPQATDRPPLRTNTLPFGQFIEPETDDEIINVHAVIQHMDVLLRVPTISKAAVMPDACPSGSTPGTIPVGGVVAAKDAIHPGFHSADICCSMAVTFFKRNDAVADMLDASVASTHFGPGKRSGSEVGKNKELAQLIGKFEKNFFLKGLEAHAEQHFMTQGDGNHFLYIGETESDHRRALVTHHGSRGLGAQVYKRGLAAAQKHTAIHAPKVPMHNSWIDANSDVGAQYWEALQLVREWTKLNHFAIHRKIALRLGNAITGQFWNEHNFVFLRDGLFYHGKGATPSFNGFSPDDTGLTLIPLNMAQPILIASHADRADALGFAPHGAGRNLSRTAHLRRLMEEFKADARGLSPNNIAEIVARETKGLDIRFFTGKPDISELPSAYKNAEQVASQIEKHKLAHISERIMPLGSIMAGDMNWNRAGR